jgi:hypothetical protein
MNLDFKKNISEDFNDNSRVWIYQSNRQFSTNEALEIEQVLNSFASNWKSHGTPVKGYASLFFGQFIVLMADETGTGVSGCSTDSSVHLIKSIEEKYNAQMFDRQSLAFVIKDKIQLIPLSQLEYALENNFITAHTLYFNNTVLSKEEMIEKWITPLKDSWLAKRLPLFS